MKKYGGQLQKRWNATCAREAELRDLGSLRCRVAADAARIKELEATNRALEQSSTAHVDILEDENLALKRQEEEAGVKLMQEQVEMKKQQQEAREKHQLQLDTERAKHLSKGDQIKAGARRK
jgi:hypothetical protein